MTRISTFTTFQSGISGVLDAQTLMTKYSEQTSSQKVSTDLKGYGHDAKRLINAQQMSQKLGARAEEFAALESRSSVEAIAFDSFSEAVGELRNAIGNALANQSGAGLRDAMESALQVAMNTSNTEFGGEKIFGGVRAYDAPFVSSDINTLAAQANTDPNWIDTGPNRTITLEDGRTVELSKSASEIFRPFVDFIVDMRKWENTNGAMTGKLTTAQLTYLQSQATAIVPIQTEALDNQASSGIMAKQISSVKEANLLKVDAFDNIVGSVQNVDMAEVATKLSAAQTQYQASASIFAKLKDLNLLNFLR